jgi:outer membrane receptor protein involved in Fe transport
MKQKILVVLLFFSFFYPAKSQSVNNLHGTITDQKGNTLIGANVYINELKLGTISNVDGYFLIDKIKQGDYHLTISYIGYTPYDVETHIQGATELNIQLEEGILLEGLVVTAQKREQSIVEIPASMTSLSSNFLENTGASQVDEIEGYIPGLQMQVQSPNNPGFVIRGITSDDGSSNTEPRVSVFQDGVSISKSRGSVVELFDMQRIEVMKGPQGTLFGRGAEIGAIHFIQNKAKNENSGSITAGYGDYDYLNIQGNVNTILVKDKLFMRLAGIHKYHEGFIKNLSGGRLNGKDTKAFRGSFHYQPARNTNFDLIYNYQKDTPPGTSFKSGTYAPAGGDTKAWTTADLDGGKDLGLDRAVWGSTLLGKHYFSPNLSLNSITAYREFDSYELFDADGTVAPALTFAEDAFGKQFSQELRLNLEGNDKFEGFFGASYFYEDGFQKVPFTTDERAYAVLISSMLGDALNSTLSLLGSELATTPLVENGVANSVSSVSDMLTNSLPSWSDLPSTYQTSDLATLYAVLYSPLLSSHSEYYKNYGTNSSVEFFADGTYKLSDKLKVTGGLRLTLENIKSSYEAGADTISATLGFASSAGSNILFMPTEKLSREKSFTSLVGRLAFNYSLHPNVNLYASVARGRRPHVIQFESSANDDYTSSYDSELLDEEVVYSYEMGVKGLTLGQQLYFDAATYYYDYSNFQSNTIDETTNQSISIDAGNASAYGFECYLQWQVSKMLSAFGNYSYIKAEFDDKDSDGNTQEYAGNTFRLTPEHSFGLGFDWRVAINSKFIAFLRPNYSYKTKVYFEEDNDEAEAQDAFGIMNVRTGIEIPKQKMTLSLFATNALDKKYIIDAGNTGSNFGIPTYIAGAPRLLGAEIKINF